MGTRGHEGEQEGLSAILLTQGEGSPTRHELTGSEGEACGQLSPLETYPGNAASATPSALEAQQPPPEVRDVCHPHAAAQHFKYWSPFPPEQHMSSCLL